MTTRPSLTLPPVRAAREDAAAVRARARLRVRGVGALLAFLMAGVGVRGVQLALEPDARTLQIATEKRWASVKTQGERGPILDADGNVLAKSVKHPAIFVDPQTVREQATSPWGGVPVERVAARLADLLERPVDELREVLLGPGRYVRLARGVHPAVADRIKDEGLTRAGVIVEENYRRFYPQGTLASQLLGFVDDSGVGQQGLEAWFHAELAGSEVVSKHPINRWGRVLELWGRDDESVEGNAVHTTIDRVIQRATEAALAQLVEAHQPVSATAVVVEVATGRILALATAPTFNPNDLGSLAPADFARTRNLAVASAVEPGSVVKPFTLAAALEAGVTTFGEVVDTTSPWQVPGGRGVRIRDDHPHPRMTSAEMIKFSSNIGVAKLAHRMGPETLMAYLEAFGFGQRTGIDTQGEVAGRRRPFGNLGPVELATISFGQGTTTSTLQLAMATATVANEGVRLQPILVDRITDPYGREVRSWEPVVVQRVVSPEVARQVVRSMEMVMEDGGTGGRARIPGYRTAGKTGTAQKAKDGRYSAARYATFVGFAPSDRPDVAMAIIVDEPTVGSRYGGVVAAPVFAQVVGAALAHRGIPPDPTLLADPAGPADDALAEAAPPEPVRLLWDEDAFSMPDLSGRSMRDALAGLQGTGVRLDLQGTGRLAEQHPPAGAPVQHGGLVRLRFH